MDISILTGQQPVITHGARKMRPRVNRGNAIAWDRFLDLYNRLPVQFTVENVLDHAPSRDQALSYCRKMLRLHMVCIIDIFINQRWIYQKRDKREWINLPRASAYKPITKMMGKLPRAFTAAEVAEICQMPRATAQRQLEGLYKQKLLARSKRPSRGSHGFSWIYHKPGVSVDNLATPPDNIPTMKAKD